MFHRPVAALRKNASPGILVFGANQQGRGEGGRQKVGPESKSGNITSKAGLHMSAALRVLNGYSRIAFAVWGRVLAAGGVEMRDATQRLAEVRGEGRVGHTCFRAACVLWCDALHELHQLCLGAALKRTARDEPRQFFRHPLLLLLHPSDEAQRMPRRQKPSRAAQEPV